MVISRVNKCTLHNKKNMKRNRHLPFTDGDICFLPEQISQKIINNSAKSFLSKNKSLVLKELGDIPHSSVFVFLILAAESYRSKTMSSSFFNKLPKKIQNYIATLCSIEDEDPYVILPIMPYTKFGYIALDNGIITDTIDAFELQRLRGVRQLGFMMDPIHRENNLSEIALAFQHTREVHSIDVAVILRLIELNNPQVKLNQNLLCIGGVSHDGLTPAGGDTTKLVDLKLFDEESNYVELFKKPGWKDLALEYNVKENDLLEMVQGKGLYGELLDVADKIAYISRDVWNFIGIKGEILDFPHLSKYFSELSNMIAQYPFFCDVWKSVRIINGKVVIKDGYSWGIFLKIRAMMFAGLYYNPSSRFLEYMLSKRIISFLLKNKRISKELLLEWKDFQLEQKINEFLHCEFYPASFKKSTFEVFETENARNERIQGFKNDHSVVVIPDDFKCVTKSGVNKFFVKKDGKVMIFKDAYPQMAEEIESIMKIPKTIGLYIIYLEDLEIPKDKQREIKNALENP